jgi:type I restriction enzyme S subunit
LAARVNEAQRLREEINNDLNRMLLSAYHSIADNAERKPLEEVAPLTRRAASIDIETVYPQIAVRSFGRGTFHQPDLNGIDITWQKPYLVKAGDILISNIKAWEGAIAVVSDNDDGRFGSHRYLTCVPTPNVATSRFVCFHLLTPKGLLTIGEASPGSADRNRTLGAKALMQIPIPTPPIEKQLWFDELYAKVNALRELQSTSGEELSALMASVLDRAFKGEL